MPSDMEAGGSADFEPVTFRMLRSADLPSLAELQRGLFPVQYSRTFYERLLVEGTYCLVGVTGGGEIVAVASARVVEGAGTYADQQEAYIMTLGVRDDFRRRGLGRMAMSQMIRLLKSRTSCDYAALHVKSTNQAALAFYESLGFDCSADDGFSPNHYLIDGKHYDAYRYTKSLRGGLQAMLREYCSIL